MLGLRELLNDPILALARTSRLPRPHLAVGETPFEYSRPLHPRARTVQLRSPVGRRPTRPLAIRRPYKAAQTDFTSVYCSSTSWPISRPQPDCLYPPKGRAASKTL